MCHDINATIPWVIMFVLGRDENIRYIRLYIFDIFDIGNVRYDISDDQYIADISVLNPYIMEISSLWHKRALV